MLVTFVIIVANWYELLHRGRNIFLPVLYSQIRFNNSANLSLSETFVAPHKYNLGGQPTVVQGIPADKVDEVHNEIASHVTNGLKSQATTQGGAGGLLSMLQAGMASGSPVVSAIEGGLVGSLGSKFGLSPMITGAIAAALPGLLQKFAHKANDPNDPSISKDAITKSLSNTSTSGLGNVLNNL